MVQSARIKVEDAQMSVRSTNCLKKIGISYLDELENYTKRRLLAMHNLGKKSFLEIEFTCKMFGYEIGIEVIKSSKVDKLNQLMTVIDQMIEDMHLIKAELLKYK